MSDPKEQGDPEGSHPVQAAKAILKTKIYSKMMKKSYRSRDSETKAPGGRPATSCAGRGWQGQHGVPGSPLTLAHFLVGQGAEVRGWVDLVKGAAVPGKDGICGQVTNYPDLVDL